MKGFYSLWILLFAYQVSLSQHSPVPTPPQPSSLTPHRVGTFPFGTVNPLSPTRYQSRTQQQNQALIQKDFQQNQRNQALLPEIERTERGLIQYELPSYQGASGTDFYNQAFEEIEQMLEGVTNLDLQKAVFLTENAYLDNHFTATWWQKHIDAALKQIYGAMEYEGYARDNIMAKKMFLHRYMADTLTVYNDNGVPTTTYPVKYDFSDIFGKKNWTKMFVTKLLNSRSGQCHSMPLLYLILADRLGIDAWFSYSPQHSYIRLQDDTGAWYNLELTNGHYSSDAWIVGSGYIEADALRHGIYMDTLSRKETIASMLVDLAQGYKHKYGYDSFVLQCVEEALKYFPKNIVALQLRSDYHTLLLRYVVAQLGYPPLSKLSAYPKAYALYQQCRQLYAQIDAYGYEHMPEEVYSAWLASLENQKEKQVQFPRP